MSFRKRNAVIGAAGAAPAPRLDKALSSGTRPSPHDGRLTTSTGTSSLDQLLANHAGMPMGTSILIEETGTTDFGGILLRYFAAEGLVQGHHVHVLGPGDSWRRELPGLSSGSRTKRSESSLENKMKIAWRYETLSNRGTSSRSQTTAEVSNPGSTPFCHPFDLAKRLEESAINGQLHTLNAMELSMQSAQTLFQRFINDVTSSLETSPPSIVHRVIIPGLLSPTLYASLASHPHQVLQFLHSLRGLLRRFSSRLTALVTLPISLYPRSIGLTRRMELLFDGVIEMIPLQHQVHVELSQASENREQGLLRIHSLPIFHEKGGGLDGSWVKEDMSFKLSASSGLVITPFSLPPLLDEGEPDKDTSNLKDKKKQTLEF
ncbi:Elongator complex protein 4 [Cladobotryum mycophilum]|uniref:Elongator complex protein 4 n=1 Tax=Cladobotryum mycophilum TaxID=491253 RepID=A0ABR0T142_9HYPO